MPINNELAAAVARWRAGYQRTINDQQSTDHLREVDDAIVIVRQLLDPTQITIEHLRELGFSVGLRVASLFGVAVHFRNSIDRSQYWHWYIGGELVFSKIKPTTLGELRQLMMRAQCQ